MKFDKDGLMPAIVQDYYSGRVLMLAYINQKSYGIMLNEGRTCFWSRSKNEIWRKGETSGNLQIIKNMVSDCDADTLLIQVEQTGKGACHTGDYSCFGGESGEFNILDSVYAQVKDRKENPKEKSYTNYLITEGIDKVCKKIGEEAAETIIAAKNNNKENIVEEISDLAYHVIVLMFMQGITNSDIRKKLTERYAIKDNLKNKNQKGEM